MAIDVYDESRLQVISLFASEFVLFDLKIEQVQADIQEEDAAAAAELAAARAKARDLEQQVHKKKRILPCSRVVIDTIQVVDLHSQMIADAEKHAKQVSPAFALSCCPSDSLARLRKSLEEWVRSRRSSRLPNEPRAAAAPPAGRLR
jgi:hypothetical protein